MLTARDRLFLDDSSTGKGVTVAVIDTGVDEGHPDLAHAVDVTESRSLTIDGRLVDRDGHGTHVAGIIAGRGVASMRYRGVAPAARLICYKVMSKRSGPEANAARAIQWAIEAGADIINYSAGFTPACGDPPWVWPQRLSIIEEAMADADRYGVLCVVAAGNSASSIRGPCEGSITRPGGLREVLTVGAIDGRTNEPLDSSGRGPFRRSRSSRPGQVVRYDADDDQRVDTVAKPDVISFGNIVSARSRFVDGPDDLDDLNGLEESKDPYYTAMLGTSQATALVSGLAARLLELVQTSKVDLGLNKTKALRAILRTAARTIRGVEPRAQGAGLPIWTNIRATLRDFHTDPIARQSILGEGPRLFTGETPAVKG